MSIDQPYKRHTAVFSGIHDYAEQQGNWHLIVDDWADQRLPTRAGVAAAFDGIVGRITMLGASLRVPSAAHASFRQIILPAA